MTNEGKAVREAEVEEVAATPAGYGDWPLPRFLRGGAWSPRANLVSAQNDKRGMAVREADVEEVAATPGFTRSLVERVLAGL